MQEETTEGNLCCTVVFAGPISAEAYIRNAIIMHAANLKKGSEAHARERDLILVDGLSPVM